MHAHTLSLSVSLSLYFFFSFFLFFFSLLNNFVTCINSKALRGLKTLHLRMEASQKSAMVIATYLEQHENVLKASTHFNIFHSDHTNVIDNTLLSPPSSLLSFHFFSSPSPLLPPSFHFISSLLLSFFPPFISSSI